MILTRDYLKNLVYKVYGAAIEVHKALGPGLLECTYHKCMVHELKAKNINFISELTLPINYKGLEHIFSEGQKTYVNEFYESLY